MHTCRLRCIDADTVKMHAGQAAVAVAAVRSWSFLVSTLPTYSLSTVFVEGSLASLSALLYSENVDLRAASGEAIALLYDSAGLADLESGSGDSGMEFCADLRDLDGPCSSHVLPCH